MFITQAVGFSLQSLLNLSYNIVRSMTSKNIWHIIIGGTIGNLTEWYNFLLYGYLASTISQLFFPAHNELISLTLTFLIA